jgi:glycosyltransferase involved in cell wall biosynthesis
MDQQLLTIGLPFARTPPEYLELAIRSVFAQTITNWELLLVADGAQPELEDRISQIEDSRVRLVSDPQNCGLAARLNQVAQMASGDVVFRMDADDLMHPRRLERTLQGMRRHDAEVIGGRAYAVDAQTGIVGLFREGGMPADRAGFLRSNAFTHPTVAGTRQWFRENPYDESMKRSEDKDLWLRTSGHTRFAKLDEVLLFYRLADLTASKQARDARYDRRLLRRHGPALVGGPRTIARVATSHAKQQVFGCLTRLGGESVILRRKVTSLSSSSMSQARADLRTARSASVPGWAD